MKIKIFLIPQQSKTYSQVFTTIREVEWEPEKKNQDKMQLKSANRPSHLMEGEDSDRPLNTPLAKQSLQPHPQHMICGYCLEPGTYNATAEKFMNYVLCTSLEII